METLTFKTDMHCKSCIPKVEPQLKNIKGIDAWQFNLTHPDKLITVQGNGINSKEVVDKLKSIGYDTKEVNAIPEFNFQSTPQENKKFWHNKHNWKRASFNTLNCLIGCSIGDFGMLFYLQAFHPEVGMLMQMVLAIIAGLTTSVLLETIILKKREKFNWGLAFQTALSMSFISMVGMELAMNTTDFLLTGGKAAFGSLSYWLAIIPSLIAGFLLPLPYNYYKLEKFGKACH